MNTLIKCNILAALLSSSLLAQASVSGANDSFPILESRRAAREAAQQEKNVQKKDAPKRVAQEQKPSPKKDSALAKAPSGWEGGVVGTLPVAPAAVASPGNTRKPVASSTVVAPRKATPLESQVASQDLPVRRDPRNPEIKVEYRSAVPSTKAVKSPGTPTLHRDEKEANAVELSRVGVDRLPIGEPYITLRGAFGDVYLRTLSSKDGVQLMVQYPGFGWEIFSDLVFPVDFRLIQGDPSCARFAKPKNHDDFYDICLDKHRLRVRAVGGVQSLS